jgi:hypothetical protein
MRMLRLVLVLMVIGFMSLPVLPVIAACTCCNSCTMGCPRGTSCCCPGVGGCAGCAVEDFETVSFNSAGIEGGSDMTVVRKQMAYIATSSPMLDRLIRFGQQCAANRFALRLLADGSKLFKLDGMFSSSNPSGGNIVALRTTEK